MYARIRMCIGLVRSAAEVQTCNLDHNNMVVVHLKVCLLYMETCESNNIPFRI
jgi:hypothetical protein